MVMIQQLLLAPANVTPSHDHQTTADNLIHIGRVVYL